MFFHGRLKRRQLLLITQLLRIAVSHFADGNREDLTLLLPNIPKDGVYFPSAKHQGRDLVTSRMTDVLCRGPWASPLLLPALLNPSTSEPPRQHIQGWKILLQLVNTALSLLIIALSS